MRFNVVYHIEYFMNFISIRIQMMLSWISFSLLDCVSFVRAKEQPSTASLAVRNFRKKNSKHGKSERTREMKEEGKKAATAHNYDYFADNNEHFTLIYLAIRPNAVRKKRRAKKIYQNAKEKKACYIIFITHAIHLEFFSGKIFALTYPFFALLLSRRTLRISLNI